MSSSSYVVMQPPGNDGDERVVFVRDGFAVFALIVPFLWLAWHRLWIEAVVVFALALLIGVLGQTTSWGAALAPAVSLVSLYVALEAGALRIAGLERRGWKQAGVVDAANAEEAEIRWFAGEHEPEAAPVPRQPLPPVLGRPSRTAGPALGMLSYPGKR